MLIKVTAQNASSTYSETFDLITEYGDMFEDSEMSPSDIINFVRPLSIEARDFSKINGNHLLFGLREAWEQSKRPEMPGFVRNREAQIWCWEHLSLELVG